MKRIFAIAPWLVELINAPPRVLLTPLQKAWRVLLVTVTLVTLCIIVALVLSLGIFAWQRSREFLQGPPQFRNGLVILLTSFVVNVLCVLTLLHIKKLDQKMIPKPPV